MWSYRARRYGSRVEGIAVIMWRVVSQSRCDPFVYVRTAVAVGRRPEPQMAPPWSKGFITVPTWNYIIFQSKYCIVFLRLTFRTSTLAVHTRPHQLPDLFSWPLVCVNTSRCCCYLCSSFFAYFTLLFVVRWPSDFKMALPKKSKYLPLSTSVYCFFLPSIILWFLQGSSPNVWSAGPSIR